MPFCDLINMKGIGLLIFLFALLEVIVAKNKTLIMAYLGRGDVTKLHTYIPVVENTGAAINIAIENFLKAGPGPLHEYDIR